MSQPQVIFFDAAGTLFHVKGSVADVYLKYAEKYGVKRTPALLTGINDAFARAFHDAPQPVFKVTDPREMKQCERLWWFDIVHNVFYRIGMFDRFDDYFDEVFQAFDGPEHWMLYPETLGVLKDLKSEGYELGIISNFDSRLFTVLRGLGLADLFATVTISSMAHAAKPALQIFQLALEKHAAAPDEAVHVGDSLRDDIEGARLAGLHALLLSREAASQTASSPSVCGAAVPTIRSLQELPAAIAALR
jgi:putative hydrolase of the HAD superfamily